MSRLAKAWPAPRQIMASFHGWLGVLAGWLLFAIFLTGTAAFFRDETSHWMRPEAPMTVSREADAVVAERIQKAMPKLAPKARSYSIDLPDERNELARVTWRVGRRGGETAFLDPATAKRVQVRDTTGGDFFYLFHFNLHYLPAIWGRWIVGICAMFMLIAIISGVITHKKIFADFFTFRWAKGQRSWLDAHNSLSVLGLPFHLMITYSGILALAFLYLPQGLNNAFDRPQEKRAFLSSVRSGPDLGPPQRKRAPVAPIGPMVTQAEGRWSARVGTIHVSNAGDAGGQVAISRGETAHVDYHKPYVLFDGVTGRQVRAVDRDGAFTQTRGVLVGLHLGRFADLALRWVYFLLSLAGSAMVATGLVLWTVKRREKAKGGQPNFGVRLTERMNVPAIAGLVVAMTGYLWVNRLLPAGMAGRGKWEVDAFFVLWGVTLAHALVRPVRKAWIEQLWTGAALLLLTPVLNALTTSRGLISSLAAGDGFYVGFDLSVFGLGVMMAWIALRYARFRPKPKASSKKLKPKPAAAPVQEAA